MTADGTNGGRFVRGLVALVCLALFVLLAPLALIAVSVRVTLLDTDRYVDTVAPLADEPAVQDAVAVALTDAIIARSGAGAAAAGILRRTVEPAARSVVASDEFAAFWSAANRTAHPDVVAVLTGDDGTVLREQDGQVVLDAGPLVAEVAEGLAEQGIEVPARVTGATEGIEVVIVSSDQLTAAQEIVDLLNRLAFWLPVAVLVALLVAILAAPDRWRGVRRAGLGLALGMALLLALIYVGRELYLDALQASVSEDLAAVLFDGVIGYPRNAAVVLLGLGLLVAAAGFLLGRRRVVDG